MVSTEEATLMFKAEDKDEVEKKLSEMLGDEHGVTFDHHHIEEVGDVIVFELINKDEAQIREAFDDLTFAVRMRICAYDYESFTGGPDDYLAEDLSENMYDFCEY